LRVLPVHAGGTALLLAAGAGHAGVVAELLRQPKVVVDSTNRVRGVGGGWCVWWIAAWCCAVVRLPTSVLGWWMVVACWLDGGCMVVG
jgi:hypothetical protein